jgi:outer membrane protein TolC
MIGVALFIGPVFSADVYPPAEVLRLVETALRQNPALASSRLDAEAAHALGQHHKAWEPPEFTVDFFQGPVSAFPNPLSRQEEIDYSVSQKIPFPGKLASMAAVEHRRGAVASHRADGSARELRRRVLNGYADLYALEWSLRLARENRGEMERLIATLRARYEAGNGRQSDWLRAESEAVRLDADILGAEAMRRQVLATLSEALGAGAGAGEGEGADPLSGLTLDTLGTSSLSPLRIQALDGHPELAAMQGEVGMAEAEIEAAKRAAYPDFMVRTMYKDMRTMPGDSWSLMIGVQAPVTPWSWKGVREDVRRARTLREKARHDFAATRLGLVSEWRSTVAELEAATRRWELSRDKSVPFAEQLSRSVREEYRQGRADFNDLVMSLREERMAKEEYHRAASEQLKSWANFEWLAGTTQTSNEVNP